MAESTSERIGRVFRDLSDLLATGQFDTRDLEFMASCLSKVLDATRKLQQLAPGYYCTTCQHAVALHEEVDGKWVCGCGSVCERPATVPTR